LQVNSSLINLNLATPAQLDSLPGVGPVTAQKIIDSRPYSTLEELLNKKIVTDKVFTQIKDRISVY
jgi:competence protein ComEA